MAARAETGDGRTAGFHLSSLYSPFETWAEIAIEHGQVYRDPPRLQVWTNTKLAETWEDQAGEARVPAIVIGNYLPLRKLLSTGFTTWQHANPGIAEDLRAAIRNLDLREVADGVVDRYEADRASAA